MWPLAPVKGNRGVKERLCWRRGCGVSILGGFQRSAGQGSELALNLALVRAGGWIRDLQRLSELMNVVLCCNRVR